MAPAGNTRATVLVVDGQRGPREALRMILAPEHAVITAASAAQARERLAAGCVDAIVLELQLPDARGPELMRTLRREFADVGLILISSEPRFEVAAEGIRCGIVDFLVKPFDVGEVRSAVGRALARRRRDGALPDPDPAAAGLALAPLLRAVESRYAPLAAHALRVAHYAALLSEALGLDVGEHRSLLLAARLHDLGKIVLARNPARPSGCLDPAQQRELRRHPQTGARLLESLGAERRVVAAVRHHHESWNGAGYPARLRGDAIPLGARILRIADAFDALAALPPHGRGLRRERALAALERGAGQRFDPSLVKEFVLRMQSGADDEDASLVAGALDLAARFTESAAPST